MYHLAFATRQLRHASYTRPRSESCWEARGDEFDEVAKMQPFGVFSARWWWETTSSNALSGFIRYLVRFYVVKDKTPISSASQYSMESKKKKQGKET